MHSNANGHRWIVGSALALVLFSVPATGTAFELDLELLAGAKGGVSGQAATEVPENARYSAEGTTYEADPNLIGLAGAGPGGGLVLGLRANRAVGLETAFYVTNDSSEGTNEVYHPNDELKGRIHQRQTSTAHHVPVLLKLAPSFDQIRPVLGVGVELVYQQSAELNYRASGDVESAEADQLQERNRAAPASYTLFQVTAGVEIDAGPVRIPIELRGGYNAGWTETFDARVDVENPGQSDEIFRYDAAYTGHYGLFAGVLYRWDFGG